jgi:hypothetical protein
MHSRPLLDFTPMYLSLYHTLSHPISLTSIPVTSSHLRFGHATELFPSYCMTLYCISVQLVAEACTSHMYCGLDWSKGGVEKGRKQGNMECAVVQNVELWNVCFLCMWRLQQCTRKRCELATTQFGCRCVCQAGFGQNELPLLICIPSLCWLVTHKDQYFTQPAVTLRNTIDLRPEVPKLL